MRNIFLISAILLALSLIAISAPTQLIYFTEHQVEKQSDFIQIGINVHAEDAILKVAVQSANKIVENLKKIVINHCNSQSKKKSDCEEVFEASKHQIQPKYQLVRKVQTFTAFLVSHEITIKIKNLQGLGAMTDKLLQVGDGSITIESFDWESESEQNPERQALKAGVQDGQDFCKRMGLKLSKIISVEEVDEKEQEEQEQEQGEQEQGGQQEEEQQEPAEVVVFKFEVQCS